MQELATQCKSLIFREIESHLFVYKSLRDGILILDRNSYIMNNLIQRTVETLTAGSPNKWVFHRTEICEVARKLGVNWNDINTQLLGSHLRAGRGTYDMSSFLTPSFRVNGSNPVTTPEASAPDATAPEPVKAVPSKVAFKLAQAVTSHINSDVYIPDVDHTFVQWGDYSTVHTAIKSGLFYPIYISGLSGNGKTMMVEQACARLKREYIRVQISPETDEDDLIGGFRLLAGETVFCKGPVIKAMEQGCILLIDEIDRGSNKIMCLQGILEGKPVLVKKTGQVVSPAPGFNVIATANTKGRGSEDGRFAAASIIDEAFLERFVATIEQPFASVAVEEKIVVKHMEKFGKLDVDFANKLVTWSAVIRKTFESDAISDLVSTRRLCHIAQTFAIFSDRCRAIELCIARFDADTRNAFLDLYTKIDPSINPPAPAVTPAPVPAPVDSPF